MLSDNAVIAHQRYVLMMKIVIMTVDNDEMVMTYVMVLTILAMILILI